MISKKQLFSFLILATVGVFSVQQNIFANNATNADSMPVDIKIDTESSKIHLGYRAVRVTNISASSVTLNNVSGSSDLNGLIKYCDPDNNNYDVNSPLYCSYVVEKTTCRKGSSLKANESCLMWFKSLRNDAVNFGKFSGIVRASVEANGVNLPALSGTAKLQPSVAVVKQFNVNYEQNLYAMAFTDSHYQAHDKLNCGFYKWDGSAWSLLAEGTSDDVFSLGLLSLTNMKGDIYVAGRGPMPSPLFKLGKTYDNKDNDVNGIAQWNGSFWSNVDGGVTKSGSNSKIYSVSTINDALYVAGDFDHVSNGKIATTNLAKWDGSAWSAFPDGANDKFMDIRFIGVMEGAVYVYGQYSGWFENMWAKWNDKDEKWSPIEGNQDDITAFANIKKANSNDYDHYMAMYTGFVYKTQGDKPFDNSFCSANGGAVYTIVDMQNKLYMGGFFSGIGGLTAANIASYDASSKQWSRFGDVMNDDGQGSVWSLVSTSDGTNKDSNNKLYVGGYFNKINLDGGKVVSANNVAKWDGASWSALGNGIISRDGYVTSLLIAPSLTITDIP